MAVHTIISNISVVNPVIIPAKLSDSDVMFLISFEEFYSSIGNENTELNLYDKFLTEFEKPVIIKTLKYCSGNQMKAAKILGLNRNTLRSKISKYKIPNKFGKK